VDAKLADGRFKRCQRHRYLKVVSERLIT
jgi:hypothetical protein